MDTATIFDSRRMLETVSEEIGLTDFGPDDFLEPLEVLTETYRNSPLNQRGVLAKEAYVRFQLTNRALVADAVRRDPAVVDRPIAAPVYIVGLGRTGSTLVQELLALCPQARTLLRYEGLRPAPVAVPAGREDPRIDAARQELSEFDASPMAAIHYVGAELPAEDYLLLQPSLRIASTEEAVWQPFGDWYLQADQTPAYRYLATLVRLLDAQRSTERWLMKSPAHLAHLERLVEQFPDVTFVWTHRDPMTAISSLCSLFATAAAPFATVDPQAIGETLTTGCTHQIESALAARERLGEHRFIDVHYDDLVADPVGVIAEVASGVGFDPTPSTVRAFEDYLAAHPQHKHGTHRYDAADYGLNEAAICERLALYSERFITRTREDVR